MIELKDVTKLHTRLWQPNLIVFVSSACIMILELVASRIIAPYVGVSLYTWTSVIGVVLAGISLGNYLGGWPIAGLPCASWGASSCWEACPASASWLRTS